jgi:hypothetical protein
VSKSQADIRARQGREIQQECGGRSGVQRRQWEEEQHRDQKARESAREGSGQAQGSGVYLSGQWANYATFVCLCFLICDWVNVTTHPSIG